MGQDGLRFPMAHKPLSLSISLRSVQTQGPDLLSSLCICMCAEGDFEFTAKDEGGSYYGALTEAIPPQ